MKKKTDKPIGSLKKIDDFLPAPEKLIPSVATKKVTISLDETTIKFFKTQANKRHKKYQQMIREVLRLYAEKFN